MKPRHPALMARLSSGRASRPAGLGAMSSLIRLSPRAAGAAMRLWAGTTANALRPRRRADAAPPTWAGLRFADSEQF